MASCLFTQSKFRPKDGFLHFASSCILLRPRWFPLLDLWLYHLLVLLPLASDCIFCCRRYSQISAYTLSLDGFFSLASCCIFCLYFFPGWFLSLASGCIFCLYFFPGWFLSLASGCIFCLYSFPGWFLLLGLWLYHLLILLPLMVSTPLQSDCIFCCRRYSQISAYTPFFCLASGCIICLYSVP